MAAAMAGGKGRKKKWSKGKVREKVANQVLFNEDTYTRCLAEVPKGWRRLVFGTTSLLCTSSSPLGVRISETLRDQRSGLRVGRWSWRSLSPGGDAVSLSSFLSFEGLSAFR
ncbi:unnamed protein product [Ectocarpus fasciculatus]